MVTEPTAEEARPVLQAVLVDLRAGDHADDEEHPCVATWSSSMWLIRIGFALEPSCWVGAVSSISINSSTDGRSGLTSRPV